MPHPLRAAAVAALVLVAGCARPTPSDAQTSDGMVVDSVFVPGAVNAEEDLVQSGALALADGAAWETVPLAEWAVLAATTPGEREAAERAAGSGAFLGDPVRMVRLQPAGELIGQARYETGVPMGTAFETEVLHRFEGPGGRLELRFTGEAAGAGRAMPAQMMVSFTFPAGAPGRVVVYLGELDNYPSEVASAALPAGLDVSALAHRYGVRYEPGLVVVLLDGETVAEAAVRLGGGPMTAAVRAYAPGGARALLLRWLFEAAE
jgi:hypothetical protein